MTTKNFNALTPEELVDYFLGYADALQKAPTSADATKVILKYGTEAGVTWLLTWSAYYMADLFEENNVPADKAPDDDFGQLVKLALADNHDGVDQKLRDMGPVGVAATAGYAASIIRKVKFADESDSEEIA